MCEAGTALAFCPISGYFVDKARFITDRCGTLIIAFVCFTLLSPALICLRLTDRDDTPNIALLITLLFLIGVFIHAYAPTMFVETQQALIAMENREPGILGSKGAVAQGFGLQCMCQFAGVFPGPLWGRPMEYRFGWGTMSGSLGILAVVSAVPMLWLGGEREIGVDEEEEPICGC
ncbi:hypothetical protein N7456_011129 [Penicillium angulare]|uniref:Major facilitator superfamily (MFS) profile domain-containing protein n=1 Tax=Penicillium angulare TaxID=116970 RepID=A0A9W9ET23_9EURO|nr:hypothetical protein N7456_011129 [Penicillium angulare]